jgi:protocatechuate 3,4-dioxygenase beta subunit
VNGYVTVTDRQGRYRAYLWPELYTVSVFTKDRGVARLQNVKVKKNQGQKLDISLQPAVVFKAKIIDEGTQAPVAGLTLYHRTRPELRGTSNAEGILEIPGALPGRDEFQIGSTPPELNRGYFKSSTAPFGSWWSLDAVKPWHRTSTTEVAIMFDLSHDMPTIELNVRAGVVITGTVTDPDGKPVAEATVSAARTGTGNSLTGDTRFSVKTKTDGTYVINLPPSGDGQYNLIAHDGAYSEWRGFANGTTEPMSTKPGQRIEGINISLHQPAMVRGKVTAPQGQSVKELLVRAHAHDKRGNRYYDPSTRTNPDGTFEIRFIRPGKHYIQVEPMWSKAEDGPAEAWTIIELKEGETKEGLRLRSVAKE